MSGVSARAAAVHFDVHPRTVRRWCKRGAPAVSHSPLRVDISELRRWRAGDDGPEHTAEALLDTLRRDAGEGKTAAQIFEIPDGKAAALLCVVFDRLHPDVSEFPVAVRQLRAIAMRDR